MDRHVSSAFSGEGSRLYGGRWNRVGTPAVYVSEAVSLAALEVLVHADADLLKRPFSLYRVQVDDADIQDLLPADLPKDWYAQPAPLSTASLGSGWLDAGGRLALRVPSIVSPAEKNLLINPRHARFKALQISDPVTYSFDRRLQVELP